MWAYEDSFEPTDCYEGRKFLRILVSTRLDAFDELCSNVPFFTACTFWSIYRLDRYVFCTCWILDRGGSASYLGRLI